MTLQEIEQMMEDTRRAPRVEDRMEQATALGILELARQLTILNKTLAAQNAGAKAKAGKKKKKKK